MSKQNGDRIIITPEFLVERLGRGQEFAHLVFMLAPFAADTEERALALFDEMAKGAEEVEIEFAGKVDPENGLASVWRDLKRGYSKMSVFERKAVRDGLPKALVEYAKKKGIV